MPALPPPLPGHECGECTACCVEMAIDDPALQKPEGAVCCHMLAARGCAIYAARPQTCRVWQCGWRFMNLSQAMRPDRSGILLMPEMASDEKGGLRVVAIGDDREAVLGNAELLDLIAKCVKGGAPIFLSHGSGAYAKRVMVNDMLSAAVADGDKARFVEILRATLLELAERVRLEMSVAQFTAAKTPGP